jgi:hypothetical protein
VSEFAFDTKSSPEPRGELRLEGGEPPKHYFESGLKSNSFPIDWSKIAEQLSSNVEQNSEHIVRVIRGQGLPILYGKGTSAKTLAERGIKTAF